MSVGKRLKKRREDVGLEIKQAAHLVGKSYQYVRQLEKGVNDPPTWELLGDFARAYGCSVDYLLELTENPRPASNESLPEGAAEIIECMAGMSPRGRAELVSVCKSIAEIDEGWQRYELMSAIAAARAGEETIQRLVVEYNLWVPRIGKEAALKRILMWRDDEGASSDSSQNLDQ